MAQNEYNHGGRLGVSQSRTASNLPTPAVAPATSEEEILADVDEPPDERRTPRPSALKLHETFKNSFSKTTPPKSERKQSLLTNALHSNQSSPTEPNPEVNALSRGMSCVSTWSNNSTSTAELTSDGGLTSPGTRTSTPSPPLPSSGFHNMAPIFNKKLFEQPVSIVRHDDENIGPLQTAKPSGETNVEAGLGRKRCITFACGRKEEAPKAQTEAPAKPAEEPPKRVCTIKFACPSKISTDAPSKDPKPRVRAVSPAPMATRSRAAPKSSPKPHRGSDATVRNPSPIAMRKPPATDRSRRLSVNSDLARSEAFRFHEFASSEEEVDEWLQESTCHRSRLTVSDTLKVENNLRQLGEEAEEEALEDEHEADLEEEDEELEIDDDDVDDEDEGEDGDDAFDDESDEGFQTDDEEGFAGSDDDSDAGSDYNWWAPGHSTAATSMDHLEHIRPSSRRSVSESSIGSLESASGFNKMMHKTPKRRKSRPVNIRVPTPELPDSTDFVCGTLDEDRPLEDAYLSCLERRRAAKHKVTPQDIDPTFPTSDPEMDEEDDDDEAPDNLASESDQVWMNGQMDPLEDNNVEFRGRRKELPRKRSPQQSPKRLRSPPPAKRAVLRSPPPRKLFGHSPRRMRSPAPAVRLRSPPPTRRGSAAMSPKVHGHSVRFARLAERPLLTTSSSLPRTPIGSRPPDTMGMGSDDEDTCQEATPPIRRAIDIKIGLEKKRQRRKEQLYKKLHRKGGNAKDKKVVPGKGCERMREVGMGLQAHKGKIRGFAQGMPGTPDQRDMHVLSV